MLQWFIAVIFLILFFIVYRKNKISLIPSFLFTLFLFTFTLAACISLFYANSVLAKIFLILLFILFLGIFLFGFYILIAFLLLNTLAIYKKERHGLAHSLTLIAAIGLILYIVITHNLGTLKLPPLLQTLVMWIEFLFICYAIHVTQFLSAILLCNLSRPKQNQNYIIVHGAGLRNGKVTPLLAGRIDKAINFFHKQECRQTPPVIILSGGQGADEARPEAEAMAEYAKEKGIPEQYLLLESKSKTTLENMKLSKQIMDADAQGQPYRAIYATSDYHLLRTGLYARKVGLKINGIGSKTALYYWLILNYTGKQISYLSS